MSTAECSSGADPEDDELNNMLLPEVRSLGTVCYAAQLTDTQVLSSVHRLPREHGPLVGWGDDPIRSEYFLRRK